MDEIELLLKNLIRIDDIPEDLLMSDEDLFLLGLSEKEDGE